MPVRAGEAKASSAAGSVVGPCDVLGHSLPGADMFVGAVGVVAFLRVLSGGVAVRMGVTFFIPSANLMW